MEFNIYIYIYLTITPRKKDLKLSLIKDFFEYLKNIEVLNTYKKI